MIARQVPLRRLGCFQTGTLWRMNHENWHLTLFEKVPGWTCFDSALPSRSVVDMIPRRSTGVRAPNGVDDGNSVQSL